MQGHICYPKDLLDHNLGGKIQKNVEKTLKYITTTFQETNGRMKHNVAENDVLSPEAIILIIVNELNYFLLSLMGFFPIDVCLIMPCLLPQ